MKNNILSLCSLVISFNLFAFDKQNIKIERRINHLSPTSIKKLTPLMNIKVDSRKKIELIKSLPIQNTSKIFTLQHYQTPNKNQVGNDNLDTGACPTFAMVGAIEAFYKRKCMRENPNINPIQCELDLSEEYFIHLNSQYSTLNSHTSQENFSSYCGLSRGKRHDWGSGPKGFGGHVNKALPIEIGADGALTSVTDKHNFAKKTKLYHICQNTNFALTQSDIDSYEYDYSHFSSSLRKRATYAVKNYFSVDFNNPEDIEKFIVNNNEIVSGHGWFHLISIGKDTNGLQIYQHDSSQGCAVDCGGHAILVIGYDREHQRYLVKSSYGPGSNYWIPYFKDDGVTPVLWNGQLITEVRDEKQGANKESKWIGMWNMNHDGHLGKLIVRRTTRSPNENNNYQGPASITLGALSNPPRIGSYYSEDQIHPVYGLPMNNGQRLRIYIDFNNNFNGFTDDLGDITGHAQLFDLYLFNQADLAAGVTFWSNHRFGTYLWRPYMNKFYKPGSNFNISQWKNMWSINIGDRIHGLLQITDIQGNSVKGQFKRNSKSYPISGIINSNYAGIRIDHLNGMTDSLNLFYHTHQSDFLSGYTKSGDGIYAVKKVIASP